MERRFKDSEIRTGLYVTFKSDVGIYRIEEDINIRAWMLDGDPTVRWILKQTHKLDNGNVNEITHDYHMIYDPAFYLIQTENTLKLNREHTLNTIL